MLRVLHVLPHRGGGAETYVDLLEGLAGRRARARRAVSASRRASGRARGRSRRRIPQLVRARAPRRRRARPRRRRGDARAARCGRAVLTTHGLHLVRRARGPAGVAVRAGVDRRGRSGARRRCAPRRPSATSCARCSPRASRPARDVVPNGIAPAPPDPAARAAARAALGLADGDVAGLYLGELSERKDPLTAVRAAQAAGPPFVLLVAGAGPLEPDAAR